MRRCNSPTVGRIIYKSDFWVHEIDPRKWHFVDHHLSHAASAFHASPFEQAAVLTLDGRGEKATTSYHIGEGNSLTCIGQVNMPHSLGLLYERMTTYLGFLHSSDEYKVMALASYGKPVFVEEFRKIIHVGEGGTYTIDDIDFSALFGPARTKDDTFGELHFNIAHSLQRVLEETVLRLATWLSLVFSCAMAMWFSSFRGTPALYIRIRRKQNNTRDVQSGCDV